MSFMSPKDYQFAETLIDNQDPENSLEIGIAGLTGTNTQIKDFLCYQALAIANAIGQPIKIDDLNDGIQSGKALSHWTEIK